MIIASNQDHAPRPTIVPLGDNAVLVRFGDSLSDAANRRASALARALAADTPLGVIEIVPNLISVMLRYEPKAVLFQALAGEIRLRLSSSASKAAAPPDHHDIDVAYGGEHGPDLGEVAKALGMSETAFIDAHNATVMRVLGTGFAPGFVYCGFHGPDLQLPRRLVVRPAVPAGSVLFAAGQTAIAATPIPTGWHVIGRTTFRNFDPEAMPPTRLRAGDTIRFASVP